MTITEDIIELEQKYVLQTYKRPDFVLESGEGVWLYDSDGREYLDGGSGIAVNALGYQNQAIIAALRQAPDRASIPVGRNVVVIGGGMTAVDAAVQSKLLGAESVTIVYRRGRAKMSASAHEQDHAASVGVRIIHGAAPMRVHGNGAAQEVEFAYTEDGPGGLTLKAETFRLKADQVMKAIGQTLDGAPEGVRIEGGKIAVTGAGRTSLPGVWAAGDGAEGGEDLTVTAVAEGRDAAEDIHASLMGQAG